MRGAAPGARGSRRWLIVAALFVITYGMAAPMAAYGVFLPILADTFGWSRGAISSALSLNLLVGGVAGFVAGSLADRYGPRAILVVTVALSGAAFALISTVSALWHLHLLVGLLGGVGMSTFYLLSATTVARWFDARRGLALALVLMGFNLGYISTGPLAAWLIARVGWRAAYAVIAGGAGVLALLAAATVRLPRPGEGTAAPVAAPDVEARGGRDLTLAQALGDSRQWYLNLAWMLMGALGFMISVHVVSFARDLGGTLAGASLSLTAYGIGAAVGRLAGGTVSDRFGSRAASAVAYSVQALGLVGLLVAPTPGTRFWSLLAFGVGFAAADTVIVRVIPDVFGLRALGAIMGVLSLGWRLGAALGPSAAGFLHDVTGSYLMAFGAAPGAALLSWGFYGLATSRGARRRLTG